MKKMQKGYEKHVRKAQRKGFTPLTYEQYRDKIINEEKVIEKRINDRGFEICPKCGGLIAMMSIVELEDDEEYCDCEE